VEVADRDPELIKADIDQARDRLALTVDSLAERANPQRIADDIKGAGWRASSEARGRRRTGRRQPGTVVVVVRRIRNG
jgi:hypothetical protein